LNIRLYQASPDRLERLADRTPCGAAIWMRMRGLSHCQKRNAANLQLEYF
jgi:hypothetical protein